MSLPTRRASSVCRWWSQRTAKGQTVLVTGIDGFAGSHLSDLLSRRRHEVHGTIRGARPDPGAELLPEVQTHQLDLLDAGSTRNLIRQTRPAWVFHLAGLSSPAASWEDPAGTIATNATIQANLLNALVELDPMPRVLVIGSGDEYGRPEGRLRRLNEDMPLRPITPYGVSKVTQDLMGLQYFLSRKLPVIRVRPFNHAGPRQQPQFAIPSFAQQIARIELGKQPPSLKVGNLEARRDFTDVRDVARAYLLALERGKPGEVYNIGSGKAQRLGDVLREMLKMTRAKVRVEVDDARKRTAEAETYVCDARRFQRLTGWQPHIPLQRTLRDTLEYWRGCERRAS